VVKPGFNPKQCGFRDSIKHKGLGKRKRQGTYKTKESQVSIINIRQNRIQAIGKAMMSERIFMYDFSPEIFN